MLEDVLDTLFFIAVAKYVRLYGSGCWRLSSCASARFKRLASSRGLRTWRLNSNSARMRRASFRHASRRMCQLSESRRYRLYKFITYFLCSSLNAGGALVSRTVVANISFVSACLVSTKERESFSTLSNDDALRRSFACPTSLRPPSTLLGAESYTPPTRSPSMDHVIQYASGSVTGGSEQRH